MSNRFRLWVTADPYTPHLGLLSNRVERMRKARILASATGLHTLYRPQDGDLALQVTADELPRLVSLASQLEQYQDLMIEWFETDSDGGYRYTKEVRSVVYWIEYLRTDVKRCVHVVTFSPASDDVGVGGYDWYPSLDDAKAAMAQHLADESEEGGLYNLTLVHVYVPAIMTDEEITRLLDENQERFEPAGMPRDGVEATA